MSRSKRRNSVELDFAGEAGWRKNRTRPEQTPQKTQGAEYDFATEFGQREDITGTAWEDTFEG